MTAGRPDPPWSSLRRGLVLLGLMAVGAAAVFFLDLFLEELSEGPELMVSAPAARNLETGAEVWVAGIPAGRVTDVRFRTAEEGEGPVLLRAVLEEDAARTLRRDASVSIRQPAMLAPAVVAVEPGTASALFDFSDTLRARTPAGTEELVARLDSVGRQLQGLRPLARRLQGRLDEGPGTLASLGADTALRRELGELVGRSARLAEEASSGSAARLAADRELIETWRTAAERARRLARQLEARAAPVGASLDSLAASAATVAARLEGGRGSLGRFRRDTALVREARLIRARLDSLRTALLADPFRWLRFRLF